MTARKVVTVQQLAERLGLADATFYSWRKQNTGPRSFKLGGRVVFWEDEVEEWLAAQEAATSRGGGEPPAPIADRIRARAS